MLTPDPDCMGHFLKSCGDFKFCCCCWHFTEFSVKFQQQHRIFNEKLKYCCKYFTDCTFFGQKPKVEMCSSATKFNFMNQNSKLIKLQEIKNLTLNAYF